MEYSFSETIVFLLKRRSFFAFDLLGLPTPSSLCDSRISTSLLTTSCLSLYRWILFFLLSSRRASKWLNIWFFFSAFLTIFYFYFCSSAFSLRLTSNSL